MNKLSLFRINFIGIIASLVFVSTLFCFSSVSVAKAEGMTFPQLVELLISIGAIPADKVVAARAVAAQPLVIATSTIATSTTTASSTAYVQVLTPNGGESWAIDMGVPYTITWGSQGLSTVNLSLVLSPKNTVCNISPLPIAAKNGNNTYKFLLKTAKCYNLVTGTSTALIDGTYKARVTGTDSFGLSVKDDSNATFKITPILVPSIKVTYPNGGESFKARTSYDIKYTLKNSSERALKISVLDYQDNSVYNTTGFGSNGVYDWTVPSSLNDGAYKIKLQMTENDGTVIEDTSDKPFWVTAW